MYFFPLSIPVKFGNISDYNNYFINNDVKREARL